MQETNNMPVLIKVLLIVTMIMTGITSFYLFTVTASNKDDSLIIQDISKDVEIGMVMLDNVVKKPSISITEIERIKNDARDLKFKYLGYSSKDEKLQETIMTLVSGFSMTERALSTYQKDAESARVDYNSAKDSFTRVLRDLNLINMK